MRLCKHGLFALFQICEESAPIGCDRPWVFLKTLIQIFNIGSVCAMQK